MKGEGWRDRFQPGSVVRLKPKYATGSWAGFTTGVILAWTTVEGYGSSAGNRQKNWKVRWDGYSYGPDTSNCHTANDAIITEDEPTESEMTEALASIEEAARKTMSKEAP